jgi:hypothetical protein
MSVPRPRGPSRALWQYHSRSDLHSKVACWGVLFDLLQHSRLLRTHVLAEKVVFGINHEMADFKSGRKKDLDLVLARPVGGATSVTFSELSQRYHVELDPIQRRTLASLPILFSGGIGTVVAALEAKAAMTEHQKALPRLFDELQSSHVAVHGSSRQALAIGLVIVNAAPTFISPDRNKMGSRSIVNPHSQPAAATGVIEKVRQLPRRAHVGEAGFDGLGVVVISAANDGSPVTLVPSPPAPPPNDIFFYDNMIGRMANEYDTRFGHI